MPVPDPLLQTGATAGGSSRPSVSHALLVFELLGEGSGQLGLLGRVPLLEVAYEASGEPGPPTSAAADQATYRILQEALTNAARHGAGSSRIELAYSDTAVELVTNPVPARSSTPTGRGHGLIGMRERATLLGGSLDAERSSGVFSVHARIPYRGHIS